MSPLKMVIFYSYVKLPEGRPFPMLGSPSDRLQDVRHQVAWRFRRALPTAHALEQERPTTIPAGQTTPWSISRTENHRKTIGKP